MRFLIAGASGFLGSHLRDSLVGAGHDVTTLVRRAPAPGADEAHWDPYTGTLDPAVVETADVVVNLAGAPTLGNPHSRRWAEDLERSRVTTTRVLADAIAASSRRPAFLAGNGISYYGDHGSELVTEEADSLGDAFLTQVTRAWQDATEPATEAGARVCILRTAPVMDRGNAPLKQQLLLFRAGLGGRIGSGGQYLPMISLRDWVGAVSFVATHDDITGPVNVCCPQTPTNAEFTAQLARLVHRPAFLAAPAAIVRPAAGRMAPELLGSVRAVPRKLVDAGFRFADTTVAEVLASALDRSGGR
jgi:uncharacterized protein (TIGR01777 family)